MHSGTMGARSVNRYTFNVIRVCVVSYQAKRNFLVCYSRIIYLVLVQYLVIVLDNYFYCFVNRPAIIIV